MSKSKTSHTTNSPTRRDLIFRSGLLGAGLVVAGGWPSKASAQGGRPLTYALSAYPPNIKPFDWTGSAAATVQALVHRGLLIFGPDGAIRTELAESWELQNSKTYIFKLRSNAVFHNGDPVTAEDVKYSLEQMAAPGSTAFFNRQLGVIERIEANSPKVVTIRLKQPTASFAAVLAQPQCPIISAKAAAANPSQPVGCGPYMLQDSEKGVSLTLKAHTGFYKTGLPKTDVLRFVAYADDSLRVAALEAGDVDIIEYVPFQSLKSLKSNPKITVQSGLATYMYLAFNLTSGPFQDARVRRAVAHGIKRDEVVNGAFLGFGAPLDGLPLGPASPYLDKSTEHLWPYDPERAKALLKSAGASNVSTTLLATATYGMHKDSAEIIQENLSRIGMRVRLSLPEWGVRVAQGNQGQFEFAINGGSGLYGDPDELTELIGTGAPSYRRSLGPVPKGIDELLAKGRQTTGGGAASDIAQRRTIYADLSRLCATEVPVCPFAYRTQAYAQRSNVMGFKALPGSLFSNSGCALESAYRA
jgi:peptide/nickel transport system substrate-binding protein